MRANKKFIHIFVSSVLTFAMTSSFFFTFFSLIFDIPFFFAEKCCCIKGFPRTYRKFIRVSFSHLINHTKYGILFYSISFQTFPRQFFFSLSRMEIFLLPSCHFKRNFFRWLYMMKIKRRFCCRAVRGKKF